MVREKCTFGRGIGTYSLGYFWHSEIDSDAV